MENRTLRFSEPEQVLEALQCVSREPEKDDIPYRLRVTVSELEATGLVAWTTQRHSMSRRRKVLHLTDAGRRRLFAARRASLDVAGAPVEM